MKKIDDTPKPRGELALQSVAMPRDTNANGDIFGGWLVSEMDLAGLVTASRIAKGRVVTVAIDKMSFMVPVPVGAVVSCYSKVANVGRSSIQVEVEVWMYPPEDQSRQVKVTEGTFVFVAVDDNGRTRAVPSK
ncbi:MAG: acyl-CoA thioesterase [Gammaproteobacteria bacterium]|nr:MAG: acyl-CoA thioesterase [Gammaproteobacteria bacterium]